MIKRIVCVSFAIAACYTCSAMADATTKDLVYDPPRGEGKYILTPDAPEKPLLNGPSLFGVRPGSPFLYTIPASGKRPMKFKAEGLPAGLEVDTASGRISGVIESERKRSYQVTLIAENGLGRAEKQFEIIVGDTICLTPPLGWNSWNCWGHAVSQEKVLSTASAIVDKGLINYGWSYVNIDDCWQDRRGGKHNAIMPNDRFPDMKAMCDEIHRMGLKAGIYSTPWITSYAGYIGGSSNSRDGSWQRGMPRGKTHGEYKFDTEDARQWADWGMDYLKYDWRANDEENTRSMADALRASGRDVVFSLSNFAPLNQAEIFHRLANAYRTTGDIRDTWTTGANHPGRLVGILDIWDYHEKWAEYCSPGHYPDPDMLVVGDVSWSGSPSPTGLTPDEQYLHISLWSLWAAPLLIGCPVDQMDEFTVQLLTNREVLAVNQDPLCVMGRTVAEKKNGTGLVVKPLADGSKAVGIFNKSEGMLQATARWEDLEIKDTYRIRDLWRQRDVGVFEGEFSVAVPPHGMLLFKFSPAPNARPGAEWGMKPYLPSPRIEPVADGFLREPIEVALKGAEGAEIFYTLDGSRPDRDSRRYSGSFELQGSATVKAVAFKDGTLSYPAMRSYTFIPPKPDAYASDLEPLQATTGWGSIGHDKSCNGRPLTIAGREFKKGLGVHADSRIVYNLDSSWRRFVSVVGIDYEVDGKGSVKFEVRIDGKTLAASGIIDGARPMAAIDLAIPSGSKRIELVVDQAGGKSFDHADWAECGFIENK